MSIEVISLSKQFGTFTALHNVSLQVHSGEITGTTGTVRLRKNYITACNCRA